MAFEADAVIAIGLGTVIVFTAILSWLSDK